MVSNKVKTGTYMKSEDYGPNETEDDSRPTIDNIRWIDIH